MISIDYTLIIVILNFVVLLFVLNKLLYKPINKFLDERKAKISEDIDAAKKSREDASLFVQQKEEDLKKSSKDIRALKKSAEKDAESRASEIVRSAKDHEKKILLETESQLLNEKEKVIGKISGELSEMISTLSAKFILESMNDKNDADLIDKLLEERSDK